LKNPNALEQDVQRYRKATPESIREFAANYLTKSSRVVVYGVPGQQDLGAPVPTPTQAAGKEGSESINADEAWRANPPAAGAEKALVLPTPESFTLANGLTVLLDRRKGLPTVAANLLFRGGLAANPTGKPGLAGFMLDMLDEGTKTRTALQFAEQLKQAGAELTESPGRDYSALVISAGRGTIDAAFDLLADAVLNPAFADAEVERVRKRRLGELIQSKEDPNAVADRVTLLALNTSENPYGYPVLGSEAAVKAMTVGDLRGFWEKQAVPRNAALVVSGDFTREELETLLNKSFQNWTDKPAADIEVKAAAFTPNIVLVDAPGAPQSQLRTASPGPMRSSPDYEPLQVMNEILGGAFSSRINLNLREQHGYSYGAYSRIRALRYGGWLISGSGVRTEVTAPAVQEMVKEIGRMGDAPVTEQEMTLAKASLVRSLPSSFETTLDTVGMFAEIPAYNLGLSYYSEFSKKVDAVTDSEVKSLAKKYLVPDKLLIVAVGDRKVIESGLKGMGKGNVQLRDADGNLLQ
jgi:zinc protease